MKGTGVSIWSITALTFVVLKLCNVVAWSWWWVLSPMWIPMAICAITALIVGIIMIIAAIAAIR